MIHLSMYALLLSASVRLFFGTSYHIKECITNLGFEILQLPFQSFSLLHMQMCIQGLLLVVRKSLILTPYVELT